MHRRSVPSAAAGGRGELPEAGDVLVEPAAHQVGAAPRPAGKRGGRRAPAIERVLVVLPGLAEQELAGPDQRLAGLGEERGVGIVVGAR